MPTLNRPILIIATVLLWLAVGYHITSANGGGYLIDWWTVDAGGGQLSGGNFAVNGTVGQADTATLTGGSYTVEGGFWQGNAATPTAVEALTNQTPSALTLPFYLLILCALALTLLTIRHGRTPQQVISA